MYVQYEKKNPIGKKNGQRHEQIVQRRLNRAQCQESSGKGKLNPGYNTTHHPNGQSNKEGWFSL